MASIKYTMDSSIGGAAVMPVPVAASQNGWKWGGVRITGHPGDLGIASPRPAAIPDGPLMRSAQPSYNSPDTIYPSQYYTRPAADVGNGPASDGIRVFSTNEMPIPAISVNRVPLVAMSRPRFGGLRQVSWPPAPMAWQNINQGARQG